MSRFHTLTVQKLIRETADCMSIQFEVPASLKDVFRFIQGQHLTLRKEINGEDLRRNYSLCSSPDEGILKVAVKQIDGGRFSTFVNQDLQVGDRLEVMPPMGKFYTELDPSKSRKYVAFAAGSGITPILSLLKATLKQEPESQFTLFYANRRVQSIIFKEEIEGLKNQYLNRLSVHYFLTREELDIPLFNGRFTGEKLKQICKKLLVPGEVDEYFLCGPEKMIQEIKSTLIQQGVDEKRIHFELFTTTGIATNGASKSRKTEHNLADSHITVRDGGKQFSFRLKPDTKSLLDAALERGADLPYACKGGVCCTCKAKILTGEVEMEVNYALEPEEVEAGYILACQSRPLTQKSSLILIRLCEG